MEKQTKDLYRFFTKQALQITSQHKERCLVLSIRIYKINPHTTKDTQDWQRIKNSLTPVILATQGIRRITVRSQPREIVRWFPSQKIPNTKRAGGVARGVGP
jgi:hypothetical protein